MKNSFLIYPFILFFGFQSCKPDEEPDIPVEVVKLNTIPEFYLEAPENEYGSKPPDVVFLSTGLASVVSPVDLDFQKMSGRENELWVLNHGTENTGSSTATIFNPGEDNQDIDYRQDGNAWHFMALATALDFSSNGDWATSQGILDANRRGGTFTGPSLWPGDMNIYARTGTPPTSTVNGSHLDMIHQSPYGMGICNLEENEYFVFDGYHGNLTYYNFSVGHYPGGADHDDGKVIHFGEVKLSRDPSGKIPGHMEIDAEKKWLYIVDTDKKRILKVNVQSGNLKSVPSIPLLSGERLGLFGEMENVEWSVFNEGTLNQPCGLAVNENRLFVSDYETGEILCFDTETGSELARVSTGVSGLMGITLSPDGNLWFVDNQDSKVGTLKQF